VTDVDAGSGLAIGGLVLAVLLGCGGGHHDEEVARPVFYGPAPREPEVRAGADCCAQLCAGERDLECDSRLGLNEPDEACPEGEVSEVSGDAWNYTWECRPAEPGEIRLDCDEDGSPNVEDCAPCDAERHTLHDPVSPDADGDGHPGGYSASQVCAATALPDGYLPYDVDDDPDCDDDAGDRWQLACLDADGDGWCVSGSTECVGDELPSGFRAGWVVEVDCDDADPDAQRRAYADEDGDGWRAAADSPSRCLTADAEPPPGYSLGAGEDCDDHDASVFPEQADLLGDGVDANCTDGDAPPCSGGEAEETCLCSSVLTCGLTTTCSDGADLAIADVMPGMEYCGWVEQSAYVAIVNRGGLAFEGAVMVTGADFYGGGARGSYCWFDTRLELSLPPGAGQLVEVDPLCQEVSIEIVTGDDCDPEDDVASFGTEASCDGW